MAIVKHIKSRNANYSDALDYLIFQHDESTGKISMNLIGHCEEMNYMWMVSTVIPILLMLNAMNVMNILKRTEADLKSKVITISSVMILLMLLNVI